MTKTLLMGWSGLLVGQSTFTSFIPSKDMGLRNSMSGSVRIAGSSVWIIHEIVNRALSMQRLLKLILWGRGTMQSQYPPIFPSGVEVAQIRRQSGMIFFAERHILSRRGG